MARRRSAAKKKIGAELPTSFIAERALLSGIVGMLPVPFADDLLLGRARRTLLRDVAKRAGLEVEPELIERLTAMPKGPRLAATGGWLMGRVLRRAALPLRLYDRTREALVSFQRATLLDHYARHHHTGGALSPEQATALRDRMDAAIAKAPLSSLRGMAQHAVALRQAFDHASR